MIGPHPPDRSLTREITPSSNIAFTWLLHLRWGAVIAQALLVLAVYFLFISDLPFTFLLLIFGFEIISNIFFSHLSRTGTAIADKLFALVMCLDIVLMTVLLHLTGGPMNPFTFLYLVHIALGSLIMKQNWSRILALFTVVNYAALFFLPVYEATGTPVCHIPSSSSILADDPLRLHLQGMWFAFAITVFFVVFFMGKIQQALEKNQETLTALEKERIRGERLASLATLSAGAAHEFSTPLSTIAVAAGEMLHYLKKNNLPGEFLEDTLLIRDQVKRCKDILYQMAADAGEHRGEAMELSTLRELFDYALSHFSEQERQQLVIDLQAPEFLLYIPKRTFGRIIRGIIQNGLDATSDGSPIKIVGRVEAEYLRIKISDTGCGMDEDQRSKACEPFYTSKEPGKGLGLGLYLAKSVVERFDGSLDIDSTPGAGTTVTLTFLLERIKG